MRISRYRQAIDSYQESLEVDREIDDKHGAAIGMGNLAIAYEALGLYQKSIDLFQEAIGVLHKFGDQSGEAKAITDLGVTYMKLGHYEQAAQSYQQALPIYRKVADRNGEARALGNLGIAWIGLRQYEKSIAISRKALPLLRDVKDLNGEAICLNNLGVAFASRNEFPKSVEYSLLALRIHRSIRNPEGEANDFHALMNHYRDMKNPKYNARFAILFGKLAINIFQNIRFDNLGLDKHDQQSYVRVNASTYREVADLLISQHRVAKTIIGLGGSRPGSFSYFYFAVNCLENARFSDTASSRGFG